MKILLSAYACEPNKGSEPEVGWQWALSLSKLGHEIYVITRMNNKKNIEKYKKKNKLKIKFLYYDLPKILINTFSRKGKDNPLSFIYFFLWQIGIYFVAKKLTKKIKLDYIHHVTFVSLRYPSFLCFINVPFIFGPVAGGDRIPNQLRKHLLFKNRLFESFRDFINHLIKYSPIHYLLFKKCKKIICNSDATKNLVPNQFHSKTKKLLGISFNNNKKNMIKQKLRKKISFCFVGRIEQLKGIDIAIDTFKKISCNIDNAELIIIGSGKHIEEIKNKIKNLRLEKKIKLINQISRNKLIQKFSSINFLIFPSLRDSGGMVILEAMSKGTVPIVLDIGGPGIIVNKKNGIKVKVNKNSYSEIVNHLAKRSIDIVKNPKFYEILSSNCIKNINQFNIMKKIKYIYR